jgi:hypothetical protein
MRHQKSIIIAAKMIFYIYMLVVAPALIAHMICFGSRLVDLIFLVPLMIFSIIFGFQRFKNMMTESETLL